MTENCLLITAADAKFFELAQGCIKSVRDKPEGRRVPLAFLDLGCTEEQITWLRGMVDFVIQPDWEYSFPNQMRVPTHLKGLLARPFLRRYFPDYEVYLWIDADAWVQDWRTVELFLQGARQRRGMAIVPEIDRGSNIQYGGLPSYWNQARKWYAMAYGEEAAKQLCHFPMLNAGVFALHQNAPHWKVWEKNLGEALQRTVNNITDQIALNYSIYRGGLINHTELLPAWCNWTCHYGLPRWDESRRCFVEPYLPHTPIGMLHLTVKKHDRVRLTTTTGTEIDVRLRYPSGPDQPSPSTPIGSKSQVAICSAGMVPTVAAAPENIASRGELSRGQYEPSRLFPVKSPRNWMSELPLSAISSIQKGSMAYKYKGIPMLKNPFDCALYPLLLWNTRPLTILEIGSYRGGSAVWFGDLMDTFGIDGHIYSIDVIKIEGIEHPRVTFLSGNGRDLKHSLSPKFLESLPRPWLVIEDADHACETTKKVLDFFHPYLKIGEYIIVEDGITTDMGETQMYKGGPMLGTQEFLTQHADEYEIDCSYCDFYGHNFTWNTNGFLRRKAKPTVAALPNEHAAASPNERDYVSPGLLSVRPDRFFPNMAIGNKLSCPWNYLRREIPHNWYVDRRVPTVGFLNRDEAAIVYNTALLFRGQPALEIGCWMGWSACHLSLAGVRLDVIDPVLERPAFRTSVTNSLSAAGTLPSVNLVAGSSPEKVHHLAAQNQRPWSLFLIDGDHEGQAPLQDSIACEPYAAPDAVVLFHDLASPAVAKGLDYFREKGWHTRVYQTMQIMGVAWRGAAQPVEHFPDPSIFWPMLVHLQQHPVSGWHKDATPPRDQREFAKVFAVVRPFTALSELRLTSLYNLAMHVCLNDLPGNFVECGTWRGGATALLAYVIRHHSRRPRRLFCFDTFEGMPDPIEPDKHQGVPADDTPFGAGTLKAPMADFLDVITARLHVRDVVTPVQGLFQDTLPRTRDEIGPVALLHADGDWYTSTMDVFKNLFDQIVPGGFVQIDDYGHWEGCKKAVHDFERSRGLSFALNSIDYTGVWLRKT